MYATILIGVVLVIVYFLHLFYNARTRALINKIPGPDTIPIFGNALTLRFGHAWFKQLMGWCCQYRSFGIFRIYLAYRPLLIIYKPEYMETILSSTKHIDKATEYEFLWPWLGTGLLTSTGEKWRQHRKMLTPTFHFNILNDFMPILNKKSLILVEKLRDKTENGKPFNVFQDIALCALDIISETAMGTDIDAQSADSEYVHAVYRMSDLVDARMRKPWFWPDWLYYIIGNGREFKEKLRILHDFTNSVIAERLKDFDHEKAKLVKQGLSGENTGPSSSKVRLAFLDMLLYISENLTKLTMQDIREEVDTFMFEGHDTTAAALNWTIHLIGANPQVQSQVHEELDRVFGGSDRDITIEDLKELKYLECCIKEALRIFPSVPVIGRTLKEDVEFGPFTAPKDTGVILIPLFTHRDPEIFPDPDTFKPERFFLDNNKNRHPYSYVPFSAGPRNCIGQKFALMEEKTILAHLFRKFSVKSHQQREDLRPVNNIILRPENGIIVEMTWRD